jgi:hypothetical protein
MRGCRIPLSLGSDILVQSVKAKEVMFVKIES